MFAFLVSLNFPSSHSLSTITPQYDATTEEGENIYVTGNSEELGNSEPSTAIKLQRMFLFYNLYYLTYTWRC